MKARQNQKLGWYIFFSLALVLVIGFSFVASVRLSEFNQTMQPAVLSVQP